ncbi:AAA family ATPase [Romboutsia lituseburensis]|uniref:AAA family ATPase n=1 Tax=Romboutsia lituseburensis TaxID=1537 RepID=UPI0022EA1E02|nr:ATP-binding protein [Romboutsia lituseburensis]
MLYGFTCKNYASYNDECIFSMEASKIKDYEDINTISTTHGKILKSTFLYGPNGSGKSNLIKAMQYMRSLVIGSVVEPRLLRINETFKFNNTSKNLPTTFEISFIINGILYTYGFEIFKNNINKEWLYKKQKRETLLFERTSPNYEDIKLNSEFKGAEEIKKHTRKDALFLTTASMLNIEKANEVIKWFYKLNILMNTSADFNHSTIEYIEQNSKIKNIILDYLRKADTGIDGIDYDIEYLDIDENEREELLNNFRDNNKNINIDNTQIDILAKKIEISTKHNVYDEYKDVVGEVHLPFEKYQSDGTKKLFNLLGPILKSLYEGEVLIIDEIDSKLHPSIVRFIISMFNSIDKNKNNGQLICNTHDVMLLQEDIRRDQVWFVEKNEYGESELYSLADFKGVRKNDAILKKYLLGVYGAVPFKKGSELV